MTDIDLYCSFYEKNKKIYFLIKDNNNKEQNLESLKLEKRIIAINTLKRKGIEMNDDLINYKRNNFIIFIKDYNLCYYLYSLKNVLENSNYEFIYNNNSFEYKVSKYK